jgi:hypothetical protein
MNHIPECRERTLLDAEHQSLIRDFRYRLLTAPIAVRMFQYNNIKGKKMFHLYVYPARRVHRIFFFRRSSVPCENTQKS